MQQEKPTLDYLSVLEFRGHDAGQFLHGQLSADVRGLEDEQAGFAGVCNPAGRLLGLLLCRRTGEGYLAICAADLRDNLTDWLGKFVLRARVEIVKRDDLQVHGLGDAPSPAGGWVFSAGPARYAASSAPDSPAGDSPTDRAALTRWRANELSAGIAWLSPATTAQFLPQMLGLERIGALSFNKGCYPGQEVIARTHYLGKLKRRPLLVRVREQIEPPLMTDLEFEAGGETVSGVLVERVALPKPPETLMLTVARMDGSFRPEMLKWSQGTCPVDWSGIPGRPAD